MNKKVEFACNDTNGRSSYPLGNRQDAHSTVHEPIINTFLGNEYIEDVPSGRSWSEEESLWHSACVCNTASSRAEDLLKAIRSQGTLDTREICEIRLARGRYEKLPGMSRTQFAKQLVSLLERGQLGTRGISADTGIRVLRGMCNV